MNKLKIITAQAGELYQEHSLVAQVTRLQTSDVCWQTRIIILFEGACVDALNVMSDPPQLSNDWALYQLQEWIRLNQRVLARLIPATIEKAQWLGEEVTQ